MSRLYGGNLDTNWIKVIKQTEVKKIISTLLDGSEHIQIIGMEVTQLDIEVVADTETKEKIDNIDSIGGLVLVDDNEGNQYSGRIIIKDRWSKFNNDLYQTKLTVSVEVV